ncbi:MAG: hypothetical protein HYY25_02025 [Candidatus Wallbacteria bacterium]|nr:hypothetical protein [Candidatus Wallbacteria bacterium]
MTGGSSSKNTNRRTSDKDPASTPHSAADEAKIPGKRLTSEQEARLKSLTGFTHRQLYNRRGWHSERGVATLLEPGDIIEEIHPTHLVIRTPEGARQTLYNLEKETPFLKKSHS